MIPNFNPNKWNREKIIDYVIGNRPLDDQQLAFLNYFDKLKREHDVQIEFEKWLEELLKEMENTPADDIHQQVQKDCVLSVVDSILDKLQELKKEGRKNE